MTRRHARAEIVVVHPHAPHPRGPALNAPRRAFLDHPERRSIVRCHHTEMLELLADADRIREYAQHLLDQYARPETKDVTIYLIPCDANDVMNKYGGVFGQWQGQELYPDVLWIHWSHTDLAPIWPVLTHELGHHLRGAEADSTLYTSHPLTARLLTEGVAERLVLEVHGSGAMHHRGPCAPIIHSHLTDLLRKERDDTPLDPYHQQLWEGLQEGGELYPPATHLMLATGLNLEQLLSISVQDYLTLILPCIPHLPRSGESVEEGAEHDSRSLSG